MSTTREFKSLKSFAAKPKLVPIFLEDVEFTTYGNDGEKISHKEDVKFYTWDRQPIADFLELASTVGQANVDQGPAIKLALKLMFDEDGSLVAQEGDELPAPLLLAAAYKVYELLGN